MILTEQVALRGKAPDFYPESSLSKLSQGIGYPD
jgi:hypothetical protein